MSDGVTIIRLIQNNAGDLITSVVVKMLFQRYKDALEKEERSERPQQVIFRS